MYVNVDSYIYTSNLRVKLNLQFMRINPELYINYILIGVLSISLS